MAVRNDDDRTAETFAQRSFLEISLRNSLVDRHARLIGQEQKKWQIVTLGIFQPVLRLPNRNKKVRGFKRCLNISNAASKVTIFGKKDGLTPAMFFRRKWSTRGIHARFGASLPVHAEVPHG